MRWVPVLALLASCDRGPLHYAEFSRWPAVDVATPIEAGSFLVTIHSDGRQTVKGKPLFQANLGKEKVTPLLLEVAPDTSFRVVRDAIATWVRMGCLSVSFLVDQGGDPATLVLPIPLDIGRPGYTVQDGANRVTLGPESRRVELLIAPGAEGSLDVKGVHFTLPGQAEMPGGGTPPKGTWSGRHPAPGVWTPDLLRGFVRRPDVAALLPYVILDLRNLDRPVSEVLRCLSELRALTDIPIVPDIPSP